jgi:hypothetical protein
MLPWALVKIRQLASKIKPEKEVCIENGVHAGLGAAFVY